MRFSLNFAGKSFLPRTELCLPRWPRPLCCLNDYCGDLKGLEGGVLRGSGIGVHLPLFGVRIGKMLDISFR